MRSWYRRCVNSAMSGGSGDAHSSRILHPIEPLDFRLTVSKTF
jgi:hypothetical protein